MLIDDSYVAYRLALSGGKPEQIFKEDDSVIIKTIVNDRFYGTKFNAGDNGDEIVPFRCDMDLGNFEILPDMLSSFSVINNNSDSLYNNIVAADKQSIYAVSDYKLWALSDSDIHAPATLLADLSYIPQRSAGEATHIAWSDSQKLYVLVKQNYYERDLYNSSTGTLEERQWCETSSLYTVDIHTGEYTYVDLTDMSYMFYEIYYADGEYVYGLGLYVHSDNRYTGSLIRLTLDTMEYEVILPDSFTSYTPQTAAN